MAIVRPSEEMETECPDWSPAASPSMSLPNWSHSHWVGLAVGWDVGEVVGVSELFGCVSTRAASLASPLSDDGNVVARTAASMPPTISRVIDAMKIFER